MLIPGGQGTRRLVNDEAFLSWLRAWAAPASLVTSVCTGSAVLAAAGLLDGYRATSNKAAFEWVREQSEKVYWVAQARWVEDRDRWTSSGVAAGMDMAAALLADLFGQDADERLLEGSTIKLLIDLSGEAIKLLTTALGRLLLGVDEPDPQTRCPGISNLPPVPVPASLVLVTGDEIGRLGNRGGYSIWPLLAGPHCRGQAHDGRLGLGDDTVPVMHNERIAARPSNVL
jgi:hypothetical protein